MFEKIIAQEKAKDILSRQIKSNKIPHAYIFMGEEGTGKMLTAMEFAKVLNCQINDYTKTDSGSCGHCLACEHIDKGSYSDLHIINFEKQDELAEKEAEKGKTRLGIKVIRYMQDKVYLKATEGKWKIFIIEPAEKMTGEAFNCLLKTLEEPPENTIIILIAKHKETVPVTILSRVQTVFFRPLSVEDISKYLQENNSLSPEKAVQIASMSEGSIEKAEKLIFNTQNEFSSFWADLTGKKMAVADILAKSKQAAKDRETALEAINVITENAMISFRKNPGRYADMIEAISKSKKYLELNANPSNVTDNLFIYINSRIKS
mgnify:CR=1 FL=1